MCTAVRNLDIKRENHLVSHAHPNMHVRSRRVDSITNTSAAAIGGQSKHSRGSLVLLLSLSVSLPLPPKTLSMEKGVGFGSEIYQNLTSATTRTENNLSSNPIDSVPSAIPEKLDGLV